MDWEPVRGDHSIERATVSITLPAYLDPNVFDELVVAGRKAVAPFHLTNRRDLADAFEVQAPSDGVIRLGFGVEGFPNSPPRRVVFQRLDAGTNAPIDEVSLGMQKIAIATTRYTRWNDFSSLITTFIAALDQVSPISANAKFVRLEMIDKFVSSQPNADHFEVLSKGSLYLTPVVQAKNSALHVHSGWFDFEQPEVRKLTNVNVDVADVDQQPDSRRRITILTLGQFEALTGVLDNPLERLAVLHNDLKELFGNSITAEAADRVALNS